MADGFVELEFTEYPEEEMRARARALYEELNLRRTVRDYRDRPVPREIVVDAIRAAATAPSGAHKQPWKFVLVGGAATKARIREAAEKEEQKNYEHRMSQEWLDDLAPLGTDWNKPFLTICPWLVAVFAQSYGLDDDGGKRKHYYVQESVGIAVGMLLATLHHAGLATLTHTPSPMGFLRTLLRRPENERAYMLIAVGYPAKGCRVPALQRKPLEEILEDA